MAIAENIERIRAEIEAACLRSGRKPEELSLMAVSKFHPIQAVEEAWNAGIRLFGESRVQEAAAKFSGFRDGHPGLDLQMIGALQRNKVKLAVATFDGVQSVDRDALITELGNLTGGRERPLPILFELNAGEAAKSGYPDVESLYHAAETALAFPSLAVTGLMTLAPLNADEGALRAAFRALRRAREGLAARFPECRWSCLSMGMSGDFRIAIEEGSTLVRIGTAIFGERL